MTLSGPVVAAIGAEADSVESQSQPCPPGSITGGSPLSSTDVH